MSDKGNVFLVGPMGSGKTAVGRQLARDLGIEFLDSDAEIERRTGVDITFIFEKEGESRFRDREKAVIGELTQRTNLVLATGGGAILDDENRRALADNGLVVYLRTSVGQQLERTQHGKSRPLLLSEDPAEVLARLMQVREPLYEEVADICVDTGGQRVKTVVDHVKTRLQDHGFAALKK